MADNVTRGIHAGDQAVSRAARRRAALALATVTGSLMVAQAATGMLFFSLYRDDQFALDAWRVNDPFTLLVAVPLLAISLLWARRGSLRGFLVLMGAMQYALYNYAFYLFGAALNAHLLLYVALTAASGLALIFGLASLDTSAIGRAWGPRTPARPVAAYMVFWAAALGVAWTAQALAFAFTGAVPAIGAEPFRLIAALDLLLVVTPVALGAAWLWSRRPWGYILAVVWNIKGALYAALLAIGSLAGGPLAQGGADGLLGLWVFLAAGSLASVIALLGYLGPPEG